MKIFLFSVLPLALVSASPIESRQAAASGPIGPLLALLKGSNGTISVSTIVAQLPKAKLAKVEELQPQLRKTAKRLVASYGPYILAGKNEPRPKSLSTSLDPTGQAFLDVISIGLCSDCTVLTGKTALRFENGGEAGPAQGIYVHHIVNRDLSKPENLPVSKCAPGQKSSSLGAFGSEFLAQGDDSLASAVKFTSSDGSANTGYYIGKDDHIMNQVDLVNYNEASQHIYITFDIEYVPGKDDMRDAAATLMSVTGCSNLEMKKTEGEMASHAHGKEGGIKLDPNGIAITESPKFPITADASIVASNGHMHDGGSAMIMLVNDKEVCESRAIYGKGGSNNDETIVRMTECAQGIKVKKGDMLSLKSVYDLKNHPLRNGGGHNTMGMADVMGMFYMSFAIDS